METQTQEVLSVFDQLPASAKYQVAVEILRRLDSGEAIEQAITALNEKWPVAPTYPLQGKPVHLQDPFAPAVPLEDWNVYRDTPSPLTVSPSGGQQLLLSAVVTPEDEMFIAQCLEIDVASQGYTVEEALANLREAVELLLEPPYPMTLPQIHRFGVEVSAP